METQYMDTDIKTLPIQNQNGASKKLLHIEIVDHESGLKKLEEEWDTLVKKAGGSLFLTHGWLVAWWRYYGQNKHRKLHLLIFRRGKRLAGIAPMYIAESILFGFVIQRRLNLMGNARTRNELAGHVNDTGFNETGDMIADPEYAEEVAEHLVRYLTETENGFDTLNLLQINESGFVSRHLLRRLLNVKTTWHRKEQDICPYIDIQSHAFEFEAYLTDRSKSVRRRIRRVLRDHLSGEIYKVSHCHTVEEKRQACHKLIQLHQKRWNRANYPGKFSDERFKNFYQHMIRYFIKNGRLEVKTAAQGEALIAIDIAVEHNGILYSWLNAYDPACKAAKHAPGIGLFIEFIKESFQLNIKQIDLMRGADRYKLDFTQDHNTTWKYIIYLNPSLSQLAVSRFTRCLAAVYKWLKEAYGSVVIRNPEAESTWTRYIRLKTESAMNEVSSTLSFGRK